MPEDFARRIRAAFGAAGGDWLRALPARLAELAERWSLRVGPPFAPLAYGYVAPARRADGARAVLKLAVPGPGAGAEIDALRAFGGRSTARLLEADAALGALLLERCTPGTPLATLEDDARATGIGAALLREVPAPAPAGHAFPRVAELATAFRRLRRRFDGGSGPLPPELVARAEALAAELLASSPGDALLHGDLHHGNILAAERRAWLAIDPKGVIGEPAYEPAAFLRNPIPGLLERSDPARVLARRVDALVAALDVERERLLGWGVAHNVLSALWSFEDHGGGYQPALRVAALLARLR